jgi:hypothetical protein
MPNYFIIGGDGKEYGPITEADIRLWISEGRLNAQTSARSETGTDWRPLGTFPEFAALLQTAPPTIAPPAQNSDARAEALLAVKTPAVALKVIAIIGAVLSLWDLIRLVFFSAQVHAELENLMAQYPQFHDNGIQKLIEALSGPVGIASNAFAIVMAALIFFGAAQMQKLKSFEFSFVAIIIALLPCATNCCAWVFGVPVAIWALIVLNKKEVKSQFK